MARKGISIGVGVDEKQFLAGVRNGVIDPLEDTAKILKDVTKAGDQAGDELEKSMRDAQRDTVVLADKFDDLNRTIRQTGSRARDLGDDAHAGTTRAKEELGELKDEAVANASETFSSFDGSIDSLVDGIQGTLGGVISNIGPLGAVAGAAAAVGVGLITAELQKGAERAAEIRQETSELVQEILAAGGDIAKVDVVDRIRQWSTEIADNKEWWELWQASAVTNLGKVQKVADATGYDMRDLFDSMSGQDPAKALDVLDDMEAQLKNVKEQLRGMGNARSGSRARAEELTKERDALEEGTKAIRERLEINDTSIEEARILADLTEEQAAKEQAAADAADARASAVGALQGSIDAAIGSYEKYISKDKESADPEAYIKAMRRRTNATSDFNDNVNLLANKFDLSQDEIQAILDEGIDFAPMLESIVKSTPDIQEKFVAAWRAAVGGGQAIVDGKPINATVDMKADTKTAATDLQKVTDQKRTATVETKADTKTAKRDLEKVADADYTATIRAVANVVNARNTLDNLVRNREAIIVAKVQDREGRQLL